MAKVIFFRKGVKYSILTSEICRVMYSAEVGRISTYEFSVRVIDGQPTFLLEPDKLFFGSGQVNSDLWKYPEFIFIMKRDGDVGRGIFVDSLEWGIFRE